MPFEKIREIFDKHIVLNGFLEEEAIIINIDNIQLGMMRIDIPNSDEYLAIPVWDFYGGYIVKNPQDTDGMNTEELVYTDYNYVSFITINALNGGIIDRNTGY